VSDSGIQPEIQPDDPRDDAEESPRPLIKPGGRVDPEAIRAAIDRGDIDPDDESHDALRTVEFELSRDLNKRLDRYLVDRISFLSRSQLQRLIETGAVEVNDRTAKASTKLRKGDRVSVLVPPPPSTEIQGEDIPIEVLYEDDAMLVLNKQPDIIVHPARSHNSGTLLNALVYYFENKSRSGGGLSDVGKEFARPGVVHRLDRDTSGVMVIAKDETAHWKLGRQFEKRTTNKRYLAIVHGLIEADADVIDVPLGPSPSKAKGMREKQVVRHDDQGKPAVTVYRVRQRFHGSRTSGPFTLVELELKTGRTHQIRVHLSHLGYPIVGDDMYGGSVRISRGEIDPDCAKDQRNEVIVQRQALHAALLGFTHPTTNEPVEFTAPLPKDLRELVALLREHASPGEVLPAPGATVDLHRAIPGD